MEEITLKKLKVIIEAETKQFRESLQQVRVQTKKATSDIDAQVKKINDTVKEAAAEQKAPYQEAIKEAQGIKEAVCQIRRPMKETDMATMDFVGHMRKFFKEVRSDAESYVGVIDSMKNGFSGMKNLASHVFNAGQSDAESYVGVIDSMKNGFSSMIAPIRRIPEGLDTWKGKIGDVSDGFAELKDRMEESLVSKGIKTYTSEYLNIQEQIEKTARKIDAFNAQVEKGKTIDKDFKGKTVYQRIQYDIAEAKKELGRLFEERNKLETSGRATKWNFGLDNLSDSSKKASHNTSILNRNLLKTNGITKSLTGSIGKLIKYAIGIRSVYVLTNKIRADFQEGSKNLVQYSKEYDRSISLMTSGLFNLKNGFAAAFAPIVNVVAPYITSFINMMIDATNKTGQFFAALTGKSYAVQAKKTFTDYAQSIDKASDSAKNLQRYLAGFDEINRLPSLDSEDKSSDGLSVSDMFDTVNVDSEISDFVKELKAEWEKADFEGLGKTIGNKIEAELKGIDWPSIYKGADGFGTGLASFLNGLISPELFGTFGGTVASALNTALYASLAFGKGFDFKNLGDSIAAGINVFFSTYDFKASAETVNVWSLGILDMLTEAVCGIDGKKVGQSIADLIKNIKWGKITWNVVGLTAELAGTITDAIIGFTETDPIGAAVVGMIAAAKLTGLDKKLGTAVTTALTGKTIPLTSGSETSVSLGTVVIASVAAWEVGFDVGKEIGKIFFPEDEELYREFHFFGEDGFFAEVDTDTGILEDAWIEMSDDILEWLGDLFSSDKAIAASDGFIKGALSGEWKKAKKWWKNNVKLQKISAPVIGSIKGAILTKWDTAKKWWKNNGKLSKISAPVIGSIKGAILTAWDTAKKWWNTDVKLPQIKFPKLSDTTVKSWLKPIVTVANKMIDEINALLNVSWKDVKIAGKTIIKSGSFTIATIPKIQGYEQGGFPNMGELFVAKESGPELVGRIGNRNAVANAAQITEAIAAAVYPAVYNAIKAAMGGQSSSQQLHVYVGGTELTDYVIKDVNGRTVANGRCPIVT